jgi:tRNA pseudouridine55 synthase
LQKVKRAAGADKAGHSGTLDPLATGLLPIGLGQGTKALPYLLDAHKRYVATIQFGATTTTGDAEGEVLLCRSVPSLTSDILLSVLSFFSGHGQQVPPMYSALKKNGKPLYALARAGEVVDRPLRSVTFHAIDLLWFTEDQCQIQVWCSKGSYIRSLAEDIGDYLGCGAHLSALRRIGVAGFDPISEGKESRFDWCPWQAVLDQQIAKYALPVDVALRHFPTLTVDVAILKRLSQGQKIAAHDLPEPLTISETPIRLYDADGLFYALGKVTPFQGLMLERWMSNLSQL